MEASESFTVANIYKILYVYMMTFGDYYVLILNILYETKTFCNNFVLYLKNKLSGIEPE
jgi:hypothetical protein